MLSKRLITSVWFGVGPSNNKFNRNVFVTFFGGLCVIDCSSGNGLPYETSCRNFARDADFDFTQLIFGKLKQRLNLKTSLRPQSLQCVRCRRLVWSLKKFDWNSRERLINVGHAFRSADYFGPQRTALPRGIGSVSDGARNLVQEDKYLFVHTRTEGMKEVVRCNADFNLLIGKKKWLSSLLRHPWGQSLKSRISFYIFSSSTRNYSCCC